MRGRGDDPECKPSSSASRTTTRWVHERNGDRETALGYGQAVGATSVRPNVVWGQVYRDGRFDFSRLDATVDLGRLARQGKLNTSRGAALAVYLTEFGYHGGGSSDRYFRAPSEDVPRWLRDSVGVAVLPRSQLHA